MKNNTIVLNFSNDKVPEFTEVRGKEWIKYGENNDYPNYLVTLFNRSAKHNAIVTSKQLYICGQGVQFNNEGLPPEKIASTQAFIQSPNPYEDLNELNRKMVLDMELFGGFYLHIVKTRDKKGIAEVYHLDYCNVRSNKDGSKFFYSDEWLNEQGEENSKVDPKPYIAYGSKEWDRAKEGILYVKQYRPNVATYALPDYIGAVNAIITDAEIANFHRAAIQNGFQGGTMIVFKNGQPSDEEMATIERQIKKKFTGTDRANTFVIDFVDDPTRTPEIIPLNGNDFDKRYDALNDTIQQEIFVGHKVTSPMLFGVRVEGQLGGRNEMATAYSLFQNTYITPKQLLIEAVLNELVGLSGRLTIKPVEPILPDFSEATLLSILTKDEMREIIGRKPLDTTVTQNAVNDAINTLSPLVANKVLESMTPNEIRALVSLPAKEEGAELPEDVAAPVAMCKHTFSKDDDLKDLEVFSKFGRPSEDYMSVKAVKAMFSTQEMDNVQHQMFALTKTEKAILDLLKTSPDASAKDVAKYLKITEKEATDIMANLLDKGYLDDNLKLTDKGAEAKTPDLTELVVMYKYEERFNAPALVPGGESRPFCKGMMAAKKLYTREEINQIGEELGNIYGEPGYDVFRRRGGWYTDPVTGVHQPACRHVWMQGIYKKRR